MTKTNYLKDWVYWLKSEPLLRNYRFNWDVEIIEKLAGVSEVRIWMPYETEWVFILDEEPKKLAFEWQNNYWSFCFFEVPKWMKYIIVIAQND